MGFLSSLFGYEDKPASTTRVATVPPELKPYVEEVVKDTQALYKQRMEEGYTPYTGDTIAGFTPEQIASQEGLKSLVGTQVPFQQEALGIFREGAERFTPETAKEFMSPYQRAVIDQEKEQAQRQYERTKRPQFEADAVRAGGMSGLGSRAAIESAEREDLQARLLADIETKGLQAAYQNAQNQFTAQKARERTMASDVATAGGNIFSAGLAEQGLLKDIGAEKQELAQSALDEAYLKYVQERQFPEQQLARYQSSIYGNPLLTSKNNFTEQRPKAQASMGKSLLGLGMTGLKAFNAGGGFGSGNFNIGNAVSSLVGGNAGGQVGGLPTLYRENGGGTSIEKAREEIAKELAPRRAAATEGKRISLERQLPNASPGKAERIREELAKLGPRPPVVVKPKSQVQAAPKAVTTVPKVKDTRTSLQKLLDGIKKTPKGQQITKSREERDKQTREQNAIMNEALARRKSRSAGDIMDSFFAGLLAPEGTPASGYEKVVADEQKRAEKIEALEDASTVKEANQLIENRIATYPDEIQIRLRKEIQDIRSRNLAAAREEALITKLLAEAEAAGGNKKPTQIQTLEKLKPIANIIKKNEKFEKAFDTLESKGGFTKLELLNIINKKYIDGQKNKTDYTIREAILEVMFKKKNK
jgi:hypothetical protein